MKRKIGFLLFAFICLFVSAMQVPVCHASAKASYLHFLSGLLLERRGNYGEALQEYRTTLALDPKSIFVYRHALRLAMRVGRMDEAMKWADHLTKVDSQNPENWVLLGGIQWADGDIEAAKTAFRKALELDEDNTEALYQMASLISSENKEKSLEYLEKYLKVSPDQAADVYYQMAILYNLQGRRDEAIKHLNLSIQSDPTFLQSRYSLAQLYEIKGDTFSALTEYLDILPMDEKNAALLNHIGEIYINSGKLPEAEAYFLKTRDINRSDPTACFWLAVLAEQKEDFRSGANYLKESSRFNKDPRLRLRVSYYLTRFDNYREAVSILEEGHEIWPKDAEISYFLALGLDDLRKTQKALEILKKLIQDKPDYREARMQYAVISERVDLMDEAETHFKILLEKKPDDHVILNYLGYSLADRNLKLADAERYIRKALELDPENGAYTDSLGWVHFRQGKNSMAMEELKKALSLVGEDETVWEHLGDSYMMAQSTRQAWYCWKVSYMLKPDRKEVAKKIERLEKKISRKDLAGMLMEYLETVQGGLVEYSSFCKITGKVGKRELKFDGIIHFKAPDELYLDIMGPLLVPLWRIKIRADRFEMDPVQIPEINQEEFSAVTGAVMEKLREFFSGEIFSRSGAELKKGWSKKRIKTSTHSIFLDKKSALISSFKSIDGPRVLVRLDAYRRHKAHMIPSVMEVKLPGVLIKFVFDKWVATFRTDRIPVP